MVNISYGVISDTHLHNWETFSKESGGVTNSRLQIILDEILRAAEVIKENGGSRMYHTGDLFHVRGSIVPSVHFPTVETFKKIAAMGIETRILAGNHDLETNDSIEHANGVESLRTIDGVDVVSDITFYTDDQVLMVAWRNKPKDLFAAIKKAADELGDEVSEWDLMIHAPVDGVIEGLPSHGITAEELEKFGFRLVLSGHYHNHRAISDTVYSVGATTHQTWGDIDSKAGFVTVNVKGEVTHHASEAPEFRDYDSAVIVDEDDALVFAQGNYVRVRIGVATPSQVEKMRDWLTNDCKAEGVLVQAQPKGKVAEREGGATIEAGESIQASISEWLGKQSLTVEQADIEAECDSVLSEVEE